MNATKSSSKWIGALFLTAMVASLLGGSIVNEIINASAFLTEIQTHRTQLLLGVFLELVNAICVLGIAVFVFSYLKQYSLKLAVGYLALRIAEAVFCSEIVIAPLSLLNISKAFTAAGARDDAAFQTAQMLAVAQRSGIVDLLVPIFFSLGAFILYATLFKSKLLPRFIAIWGLVGAVMVFIVNIVSTFVALEISIMLIFAFPIILNEIFLGIWLIVKGFNKSVAEAA